MGKFSEHPANIFQKFVDFARFIWKSVDLYFAQSCVGNYCYKKMGKKEMGNKQSGTKECKFNPSLQLLNARFSRKIAHCFL